MCSRKQYLHVYRDRTIWRQHPMDYPYGRDRKVKQSAPVSIGRNLSLALIGVDYSYFMLWQSFEADSVAPFWPRLDDADAFFTRLSTMNTQSVFSVDQTLLWATYFLPQCELQQHCLWRSSPWTLQGIHWRDVFVHSIIFGQVSWISILRRFYFAQICLCTFSTSG